MGIFASQFLVPFSDTEHRKKGHMAQGSVNYVAFAFYEMTVKFERQRYNKLRGTSKLAEY